MAEKRVDPHLFVVFGATGDLMRRKLLPALYHLCTKNRLGERFKILGVARKTNLDDEGFRTWAREALEAAGLGAQEGMQRWCDQCLHYQPIGKGDAESLRSLGACIERLERDHDLPGNRAFYLALPPSAFPPTIEGLGAVGLNQGPGWTRLVIEKPFGRDLTSAQALNQQVHQYFDESQIYRIDHYLGKETVQNLLVFRFANPVFESIWNRDRVESVQITVAESLGVEARAGYYDKAGALRDMVQSHLTQLLTLTAMEVPATFEADALRDEKVKVLRSIAPLPHEDVVFGQYAYGRLNGQELPGYRDEPGVGPDSHTETFVALRLEVANWRWQGVPFYLRTGKRLPRRLTQITVTFRCPPVSLFHPYDRCQIHANALVLTLQPDEGFDLCFEVKTPGEDITMQTQNLHFRYAEAFGPLPDGYETLLFDVLTGDQTLFVRADEVEAAWRLYAPLLEKKLPVRPYEAARWGPKEANQLLAEGGHQWLIL